MLILKPSAIQGVGVFATATIRKGTDPRLFPVRDWLFTGRPVLGKLGRYSVLAVNRGKRGTYYPRDAHRMSIGWYLNHSDRPNIDCVTWRATRRIGAGRELTIDYNKLEPRTQIRRQASRGGK